MSKLNGSSIHEVISFMNDIYSIELSAHDILVRIIGATCVGTFLCSASANTFNQWIEIERDRKMMRTRARPLPSGRVMPNTALTVGIMAGKRCLKKWLKATTSSQYLQQRTL